MGALVNLASGACALLAGVAAFEFIGVRNTGGASVIGPPVISGRDLPDVPDMPRPVPGKPRAVSFYADRYGQFRIDGTANGATFHFLADTGATEVVFDKRDARRLGLDVNRLVFDGIASTANGMVRTASARIARLSIGPFTAVDVPVSINEGEVGEPLLGMAFLRRMNVSMSNGILTLSGEP
jgi:clan AA aspartic protease (TIGR02281 family)